MRTQTPTSNTLQGVGQFERRQILAYTEELLNRASVIDTLPTPLDEVRRAAGIRQRIDISQLPKDIAAVKPSGMRQIIGAYLFRERVVFIDGQMAAPRQRFTDGHEITH